MFTSEMGFIRQPRKKIHNLREPLSMRQQKKRLQYLCRVQILKQTLLPIPLFPESLQSLASFFHCDSSAIPLICCGFLPASACLIAALQPQHCNSLSLCSFSFTLAILCPLSPERLRHQHTNAPESGSGLQLAVLSWALGTEITRGSWHSRASHVGQVIGKNKIISTSKISPLLKT